MLNILQAHLSRAFVANSMIDGIYALYPESFCNKNLAIWKVFAFSDSVYNDPCSLFIPVHLVHLVPPLFSTAGALVVVTV